MLPHFWAPYSHTTLLFKIGYLTDIENLTNPKWNSWFPPQTCSPIINSNILFLSKWYTNHSGAQVRNVGITLDFSFSSYPTSMQKQVLWNPFPENVLISLFFYITLLLPYTMHHCLISWTILSSIDLTSFILTQYQAMLNTAAIIILLKYKFCLMSLHCFSISYSSWHKIPKPLSWPVRSY